MKTNQITYPTFLLLLFLIQIPSVSQHGITSVKFRSLDEDTFIDENIRTVFQDTNGYIWAGIDSEGLCVFNGSKTEVFGHESSNPFSIASNYINHLAEDTKGNIWLATERGLNVFVKSDQVFFILPELSGKKVNVIHKNDNGQMWVGHEGGILTLAINIKTEAGSDLPEYKIVGNTLSDMISDHSVTSIYKDHDETYWIGTENGLFNYSSSSESLNEWANESHGLSDNEIKSIVRLNKDHLLIGTDNGVNLFNPVKNQFDRLEFRDSGIFNFGKVGIRDIMIDSYGTVWIGTNTYGIITGEKCVKESDQSEVFIKTPKAISGLTSKYITDIMEDQNSQIWIATKFGGIFLYDHLSSTFPHFKFQQSGSTTEENASFIISATEDPQGNIWIGTRARGLISYNPSTNTYKEKLIDHGEGIIRRIESIYHDSEKYLWVGHKKGLNRIDLVSWENTYFDFPKVVAILETPNKRLWIGTHAGLYLIDKEGTKLTYSVNHQKKLESPELMTTRLLLDKEQTLWVGTNKQGVFKFNSRNDQLIQYAHQPSNNWSLSGNSVRSLHQDQKGQIWVGTKSSGLNLLQGKKFLHLNETDGLPSNTIFSIVEDPHERLWITTNNGLCRYNYRTRDFTSFSIGHGLQGKVFEKYASLRLNDGRLFIAGNNGFNLFHPDSVRVNPYSPSLAITEIKANDQVVEKDVFNYASLELPYDQNIISFEFSALDFKDTETILYKYKLDGVDKEWNYTGSKNNVTYSNLSAGTYMFELCASNSDGSWSDNVIKCGLVIHSPPWLTWWAKTIYCIVIFGFIYLVYFVAKIRTNYANSLKTKELQLRQNEELNQIKLRFFTNISHELRTPLTLILAPLEKLRRRPHRDLVSRSVAIAYRSARQLLHLTDQLLYFRKVDQGCISLKVQCLSVERFMSDILEPYKELAESRSIALKIDCDVGKSDVWFDPDKLEKIINNLMINAFKFTPKYGQVTFELQLVNSDSTNILEYKYTPCVLMKLMISNSGDGIDEEKLKYIFKRYYQIEGQREGIGIGLELVKSFVKIHYGVIHVESEPGKRTSFQVFIPVDKQMFSSDEIQSQPMVWQTSEDKASLGYLLPYYPTSTAVTKEVNSNLAHRPKILIVEDHPDLLNFLTETFSVDFKVLYAPDGNKAWSMINENNPDLVLTDVMMPCTDGLELCRKIKANLSTSHIPVVMLTARNIEEHQIEGFECGADAYVTKPFDVDVLRVRLKSILNNRSIILTRLKEGQVFEPEKVSENRLDVGFLSKIIGIMNQNYSRVDFNVEEFAFDLNLSRSQLFRKMKALTGQTPSEYLYAFRIKKAIQLLEKEEYTIAQIAYKTGFSSPNSFSKTFSKHMRVSPSKYLESQSTTGEES